ncbi:MAG: hypothetical protein AAB436_00310 [Patescibacteria group bacterium]
MTSKQQQNKIIYLSLIATPVICLLLGLMALLNSKLYTSNHPLLNDDGSNWSILLPYIGVIYGLIGSVSGLVLGTITAHLMRRSKKQNYALYAYLLPAAVPIIYMFCLLVLGWRT